jgi:hypothetical protein
LDGHDDILRGVGGFTHDAQLKTTSRSGCNDLFAPPWREIQSLQVKPQLDLQMVPIDRFFTDVGPWVPIGLDTYTEIFLQRKKEEVKEARRKRSKRQGATSRSLV